HQLLIAMALRERLPRVDEVFHRGRIGLRVVSMIVFRTALVTDPQARARIDYWVDRYDPLALRRTESRARGRGVEVSPPDGSGVSTVEAVLFDHDAAT